MNPTLKVNGLNVDSQAIADGLYNIICEAGEEAIVAFGMIPKWAIDAFEAQLRDKIVTEAAKQMECTAEELKPHLSEKLIQETMRPIVHAVSVGIYTAASRQGRMIV